MASVDIYQMTTKDTNHKVAPVTIFDAVVNPLNKKTLDQEFEDMVGAVDESVAVDDADATLVTTALRKTEQVLTLAEKQQARTNINAADADALLDLSTTVSENKIETDAKLSELGSEVVKAANNIPTDYTKTFKVGYGNHSSSLDRIDVYILKGNTLKFKITSDVEGKITNMGLYTNSGIVREKMLLNEEYEIVVTEDTTWVGLYVFSEQTQTISLSVSYNNLGYITEKVDDVAKISGRGKVSIKAYGEHSSSLDRIEVKIDAEEKLSLIVTSNDAVIKNVQLYGIKQIDGSSFNIGTLTVGEYATFNLSYSITHIGLYFVTEVQGSIDVEYSYGDNAQIKNILHNTDTYPIEGSDNLVKSDGVYKSIPLSYKMSNTFNSKGDGGYKILNGVNLQKGRIYKITYYTTVNSNLRIKKDDTVIDTISTNIKANTNNEYYYTATDDIVCAHLYSYMNGSGTFDVSIEPYWDEVSEAKTKELTRKRISIYSASGKGEHSSNNDRVAIPLFKGTYVNFRLDEISISLDVNFAVYGSLQNGDKKHIITGYKNQDNIAYILEDYIDVGVYFYHNSGGVCNFTIDASDYISAINTNKKIQGYLGISDSEDLLESIPVDKNEILLGSERIGTSKGNVFSFLWFSDTHGFENQLIYANLIKSHYKYYDDIFATGDLVWNKTSDDFDYWAANGGDNILIAIGNHETSVNGVDNVWSNSPQGEVYAKFIEPYINNWGVTNHLEGKNYYYKDYSNKLRVIVVDLYYSDEEELSWFEQAVDSAKEGGFTVVCVAHERSVRDLDWFNGLRTVWDSKVLRNGLAASSDVIESYYDIIDNFISEGGNFVCWFGGHTHKEEFVKIRDHQLWIGITTGIPEAQTDSQVLVNKRVENKCAINSISIDVEEKEIHLLRFGRVVSKHFAVLKPLCFDYDKMELMW